MFLYIILGFAAAFAGANAPGAQRLTKPPIAPSLDYLKDKLLSSLPATAYTLDQWPPGYIAADCAQMTKDAGLNPGDVDTWNVHYSDVSRSLLSPLPIP